MALSGAEGGRILPCSPARARLRSLIGQISRRVRRFLASRCPLAVLACPTKLRLATVDTIFADIAPQRRFWHPIRNRPSLKTQSTTFPYVSDHWSDGCPSPRFLIGHIVEPYHVPVVHSHSASGAGGRARHELALSRAVPQLHPRALRSRPARRSSRPARGARRSNRGLAVLS